MTFQYVTLPDHPELAATIKELAADAEQADGFAPLSEQFLVGLMDARAEHTHIVAMDNSQPVGAAAIDGNVAEAFITPSARGLGWGRALLLELQEEIPDVQIWAHGNLPAAQALGANLEVVRHLIVMEVKGENLDKAAQLVDVDYEGLNYTESVERFGRDFVDAAWVEANNEAFDWHPEQGGWDIARLHRGMEAEWFDPADVLFYWDLAAGSRQLDLGQEDGGQADGQDGKEGSAKPALVGFHWTKWHTESEPHFGEVYVVGLASDYRGQGLGGPLLSLGLHRQHERGANSVILYVEADNAPAVKAYEKLGFRVIEDHVVYAKK